MSTHNICFRGEIRKILCGYTLLSVAMIFLYILPNEPVHDKTYNKRPTGHGSLT